MTKNINKPNSSTIAPSNNNSSLENFHNASGQNLSEGANTSEQLSKEFETKAGNLGYGIGKAISNNPIIKAVAGFFGSKSSKNPHEVTGANRALLQIPNATELSASCKYLLDSLNLDNANKILLIDSTQKIISKLTLRDREIVAGYLSDVPNFDIIMATNAIAKHFNNDIAADKVKDLLQKVHDITPNKGNFVSFVIECLNQEHPDITYNPTNAPTQRPTKQPTQKPTSRPTTQAPSYSPTTQSPSKSPIHIAQHLLRRLQHRNRQIILGELLAV